MSHLSVVQRYVWLLYATTIYIIFKSDHIMSKITIFMNKCFLRFKTRIELPKCIVDARNTFVLCSLERFQIKTRSNKPRRSIVDTPSQICVWISYYYYESKRNEMYWIEYDLQQRIHDSNGNGMPNKHFNIGRWAIFWYLVCIEFRSCYNFNCLLFVVRFQNESIQVYPLIFTLTLLFRFCFLVLGFVMCRLL